MVKLETLKKTKNSVHRRLETIENEITSKRTMLAMNTIKLEKLPTKQDGRQHTSPLKYVKTDGPSFINFYLSVQKCTQNYTRRHQMDKWNKPENTRDITGCIGESIQNWEPYLGTYKNTATADIYIASQKTCDSNPATWKSEMNDKQYKVLGENKQDEIQNFGQTLEVTTK